tara:strand:- start:740 stop:1111 length:372 start_codon:yes stop_codon:yes gene_type:complete
MKTKLSLMIFTSILLFACNKKVELECNAKAFEVSATAYNSLAYQTSSNPNVTAFGDSLKPGMRYIAVSRDLLDSGLVQNTRVKLEGCNSLFTVKDKMNRRWIKRIDIYTDINVQKAKNGVKRK